MVGLVFVSHSEKIAEGVRDLAAEMAGSNVPMAAAGGTGDGRLGTNAERILAALQDVQTRGAESALVFVDLGSAVMSAEIALEASPIPARISNAPLVEGAIVAAVEASTGSSLEETAAAADQTRSFDKVVTSEA